jgi:hypothetical protein
MVFEKLFGELVDLVMVLSLYGFVEGFDFVLSVLHSWIL